MENKWLREECIYSLSLEPPSPWNTTVHIDAKLGSQILGKGTENEGKYYSGS